MATHELKTLPAYWDAVARGEKLFEVRKNDRFYQAGDVVELLRYEGTKFGNDVFTNDPACWEIPAGDMATTTSARYAKRLKFRVGPILQGGQFGIEPGHCVFSLLPVEQAR